eukprot:133601-Rhodomonas_salina.1
MAVVLFATGSTAWSVGLSTPMLRASSPTAFTAHPTLSRQSLWKLPLGDALRVRQARRQTPTMMEPVDALYGIAILSSMLSFHQCSVTNAVHVRSRGEIPTLRPAKVLGLVSGAVVEILDQEASEAASLVQKAALKNALLLAANPVVAKRASKTLVRSTTTLVKNGASSIAEKQALDDEYPAESALITDVSADVVENLLDWTDKVTNQ